MATHTDPRGLTVTNTWDALQRLRRVDYPDGTFLTNTYNNLDLVRVVDRMGFTNSFGYNAVRQLAEATNANGVVTIYTWCNCGSLESVTNAFRTACQEATQFYYDNQGNRIQTVGPDNYIVSYHHDALGQLTNVADAVSSVTNWYNNQGLRYAVSNAFGCVEFIAYDTLDRATNRTDANAVAVANTFDHLDRLLARSYPDTGVERFGYTPNIAGLTSYTNQLGSNVVKYSFDPLGRKTAEVYPGITTNQFAYTPAGDLWTLTDGKAQITTWYYDQYGRATNKWDATNNLAFYWQYDSNNRLTNRWTPAKGNTGYGFDPVDNLTSIVYQTSPAITLLYDALNRLTNMVDAVGTTRYTYSTVGQVLTEDGPWTSDTVSYTYENRLRKTLSLQAPNASPWAQAYDYDAAKRLTDLASPAGNFHYHYHATRSTQHDLITLPNGAFITNTFDNVARLLSTVLKGSDQSTINSHSYQLNEASQRTRQSRTAGDYADYTYDNAGQLQTARGKESDGTTSRLHEQFGYLYDPAGNLNHRTNNALVQTFGVNELNQLKAVSRSGTLTVAGTTTSPATGVTVNDVNAVIYGDSTFARTNVALVDGTNVFTTIAQDSYGRRDTNTSVCFLPSSVSFGYDLNGNLVTNGTEVLVYDDENQLVTNWVAASWKSEFVYDGLHRRRIQRDYTWTGASWALTNQTGLVYDGNLIIQHRDANNLPTLTLTRGMELSGTFQGAGGIGGLLALTQPSALNPQHLYYHADGNGNY